MPFDIICMFRIVFMNMEVHVIYDCNISYKHQKRIIDIPFDIICVLCIVFLDMQVYVIYDCNIGHEVHNFPIG